MTVIDPGNETFKRTLSAMHDEGQGVWKMIVASPHTIDLLRMAAALGDPSSCAAMSCIDQTLTKIGKVKAGKRMLCLMCDTAFSRKKYPLAFVIVFPYRDKPSMGVINGVCEGCYDMHNVDLPARVADYYRKNVMEDFRLIPTPSKSGTA